MITSDLPSGHEPVALEWELVEAAHNEAVARVEFRWAVIAAGVVNVLDREPRLRN